MTTNGQDLEPVACRRTLSVATYILPTGLNKGQEGGGCFGGLEVKFPTNFRH